MTKGLHPQLPNVQVLRQRFLHATPFRHICIDNFLEPALAAELLRQFPVFDEQRAKNEFGIVGGKATEERVRRLGSAYADIDDLVKNSSFLEFLSELTGIPDLEYDPAYFGGGTHENRHGQELDVHVDFNRDPSGTYRRLNLIIYLNTEWIDEWGGAIEIHSNPRDPETNQVVAFTPIFNRCVLFETHETSWHGFPLISLPPDKRGLSRKSFSVYFYSRHAPDCGETPRHSTFYVQRWLPKNFLPGKLLTDEDVAHIKRLLTKRDHWIEFYQKKEIEFSRERESLNKTIDALAQGGGLETLGYIRLDAPPIGWFPDKWCAPEVTLKVRCMRAVKHLVVRTHLPAGTIASNTLTCTCDEIAIPHTTLRSGTTESIICSGAWRAGDVISLTVSASESFAPVEIGLGSDPRMLAWMLVDITSEH